jgi:hypothetical protein
MREHQIVITLKPEQFAAVQKLAKASGAKSMGIFVRKELLGALGIDAKTIEATMRKLDIGDSGNKDQSNTSTTGGVGAGTHLDLTRIAQDIRRMRADLQDYIQPPAELVPIIEELEEVSEVVAHNDVIPPQVSASVPAEASTTQQEIEEPIPIEEDTLAIIAEALISGSESFVESPIEAKQDINRVESGSPEAESAVEVRAEQVAQTMPEAKPVASRPLSDDPLDDLLNDFLEAESPEPNPDGTTEFQVTVPAPPSSNAVSSNKDASNKQNNVLNAPEDEVDNSLKQKPRTPGFGLSGGPPPKRDQ